MTLEFDSIDDMLDVAVRAKIPPEPSKYRVPKGSFVFVLIGETARGCVLDHDVHFDRSTPGLSPGSLIIADGDTRLLAKWGQVKGNRA